MGRKSNRFSITMVICGLFLALVLVPVAQARAEDTGSSWDIILKVNRLEETLTIIDELLSIQPGEPSPTVMLRGMLQGTGWIDSERSIVVGVAVKDPKPVAVALIPFKTPNPNFEKMFNAVSGPDYQMISLPPGEPVSISTQAETTLVAESQIKMDKNLSLEISVGELIKKGKAQVLSTVEKMGPGQQGQKPGMSPAEIKRMSDNVLETARALETFGLGLTLTRQQIDVRIHAVAVPGTNLEKLFSPENPKTHLTAYHPDHYLFFRVTGVDFKILNEMMETSLGPAYQKMGIDLSRMLSIMSFYSGEMAGGFSYGTSGPIFESIVLLKESEKPDAFFESHYLPWLEEYSKVTAQMIEKKTGKPVQAIFHRTEGSEISGHKVYGIETKTPLSPMAPGAPSANSETALVPYEMRMTLVDRFLLTAPDDQRIGELIQQVKTFSPQPVKGPLGLLELDVAGYMEALKKVMPNLSTPVNIPNQGTLSITMNMKQGRMEAGSVIDVANLRETIRYFKTLSTNHAPETASTPMEQPSDSEEVKTPLPAKEAEVSKAPEPKKKTDTKQQPQIPRPPRQMDYKYYMDQGGLVAAYENNSAAVKYYKKAIKLNPDSAEAYFYLGVSHGELGQYEKALEALDKAIAMDPENGTFHYGRGRVFLQAGHRETGMLDIRKAAQLGNQDAQKYLR